MKSEDSKLIYDKFIELLKLKYQQDKIKRIFYNFKEGQFGGYSQIEIINDGPVTICLET